jgi:uncharacterized protein YacL
MFEARLPSAVALVITAIGAISILGIVTIFNMARNPQSTAAIKELFFATYGLIFSLLILGLISIALIRYFF